MRFLAGGYAVIFGLPSGGPMEFSPAPPRVLTPHLVEALRPDLMGRNAPDKCQRGAFVPGAFDEAIAAVKGRRHRIDFNLVRRDDDRREHLCSTEDGGIAVVADCLGLRVELLPTLAGWNTYQRLCRMPGKKALILAGGLVTRSQPAELPSGEEVLLIEKIGLAAVGVMTFNDETDDQRYLLRMLPVRGQHNWN